LKLLYKLIVVLLLVAVIPLALSGWISARINEEALVGRIAELHRKTAQDLARDIEQTLLRLLQDLELQLGYIRFRDFNPEEMEGGLNIVYLQNDSINVVSLLDENGRAPAAVPSKYITNVHDHDDRFRRHRDMTLEELEEYSRRIPFHAAQETGVAIGDIYVSHRKQTALLPLCIAFPGPSRARWALALELSLNDVQHLVASQSWGSEAAAFLVDNRGALIAHRDLRRVLDRETLSGLGIVEKAVRSKAAASGVERFTDGGEEMLGAYARLSTLGWGLVLYHPVRDALASVQAMRSHNYFWLGASIAFAVIVGIFFARGISRPVNLLAQGARRIAQGDFDHKIKALARDEIGLLSEAFNSMGTELQRSLERIAAQNRELEQWNEELQKRVNQRTRELREAQDQLLLSKKLAAVGELGAGVAHEINNPLAGVLGVIQLLLIQLPPEHSLYRLVQSAEKETLRIRDIVRNLQRFSDPLEGGGAAAVDVSRICDNALKMIESQFGESGIQVVREYAEYLPRISGHPGQLEQCLLHLFRNAHTAMSKGGRLTVHTGHLDRQAVIIRVSDTGRGIRAELLDRIFEPFFTTKDEWSGQGMGLSMAYTIVQDHKGKITVESEVGKGTSFTLTFPVLAERLHLE
jgi:signal transduction histidine kinase